MRKVIFHSVAAAVLCCFAWTRAAEPITAEAFATLCALARPAASEQQWREIRWGTNLWEARERAAREGRPILLWEMDGHPLGCT
jgi:hypothetical protein